MFGQLGGLFDRFLERGARYRRLLIRLFLAFALTFTAVTFIPLSWRTLTHFGGWSSLSYWYGESLSAAIVRWFIAYLLPPGETVIAYSPWDPFTVITEVGAAISLAAVGTYLLARFLRLARRAMWEHERRWASVLSVLVPGLFAGGCALGLWLLPYVYAWLATLGTLLGVSPVISLTEFVGATVAFAGALGLCFELPALCLGLSAAGLLKSPQMRRYAPLAFVGCVAMAFVVSPGIGGGLIELPMGLGFFGLYWLGYWLVRKVERGRRDDGSRGADAPAGADPVVP